MKGRINSYNSVKILFSKIQKKISKILDTNYLALGDDEKYLLRNLMNYTGLAISVYYSLYLKFLARIY